MQRNPRWFPSLERSLADRAVQGEWAVVDREALACQCSTALDQTMVLLVRRALIEAVEGGYRFQVELIRRLRGWRLRMGRGCVGAVAAIGNIRIDRVGMHHHNRKRRRPWIMIDLYSDTVTQPTPGMRQAMAQAAVGDEQRGEDPTTNALQTQVAVLLGKEASIFLPSATMANAIACRLHTKPGEAIICDERCHILNSETGGLAVHSGVVPRIVHGQRGHFTPEQVEEQLTLSGHYRPITTLLACEQTHNAAGGSIWPLEQLQAVCQVAHDHGLKTHLDGARLLNAAVASNFPAADYAAPFDTVMLCLSKGLGCPIGALLAGSADDIARARTLKQQFGGSMRQSGILAAAGLYALEHNVQRLAEDHDNAHRLAEGLADLPGFEVEMPIETNMVFVNVQRTGMTAATIAAHLRQAGVGCSQSGPYRLRFVTHLDVCTEDIGRAVATARAVLG